LYNLPMNAEQVKTALRSSTDELSSPLGKLLSTFHV
jgi:hypothetical protein